MRDLLAVFLGAAFALDLVVVRFFVERVADLVAVVFFAVFFLAVVLPAVVLVAVRFLVERLAVAFFLVGDFLAVVFFLAVALVAVRFLVERVVEDLAVDFFAVFLAGDFFTVRLVVFFVAAISIGLREIGLCWIPKQGITSVLSSENDSLLAYKSVCAAPS